MGNKLRHFFLLIFFLATIWFLVDINQSWSDDVVIQYHWLFFALIFALLDTVFDYLCWKTFLNQCYQSISTSNYLIPIIFIASFASDLLPAKMGTFSRPFLLKSILGVRLRDGSAVHINALFSDFSAAAVVAIMGLFYWGYALFDIVVVMSLSIITVLMIVFLAKLSSLQAFLMRLVRRFFPEQALTGISSLQQGIVSIFGRRQFMITFIYKLISWFALGLCLYSVVQAMGFQIHLIECVFIVTMSSILGILSLLPGGLLVVEASIVGFLSLLNIPINLAIFIVFIYRLFSFWLWIFLGNILAQLNVTKKTIKQDSTPEVDTVT